MSAAFLMERSRIVSALSNIPASDRDLWLKMGMAVKSALSDDDGFAVWAEWSQSDDSYNERDAMAVWKSIDISGGIGVGTLFHHAKMNGWQDQGEVITPTPAETAQRKAGRATADAAHQEKEAAMRLKAMEKAAAIWSAASPVRTDHPYLTRKQVLPVNTLREIDAGAAAMILGYVPKSSGEALTGRLLVAPIKIDGLLSSCELIDQDGRKAALVGRGTKTGGYWAAQPLPQGDGAGLTMMIAEGVATTLSVKEASGHPSIAALSAGNLPAVAKAVRQHYPAAVLVLVADLLKATGTPDPHAIEAAQSVGGLLAIPDFGADRPKGATDFNDMAALHGTQAVQRCIDAALNGVAVDATSTQSGMQKDEWSEPESLARSTVAFPYPVNALPAVIRLAVEEVQGFTKAPTAMVACSALANLSLAAQAHHDVQRAEKLSGAISLYFLVIADSGERKSTCDGMFSKVLRDYEAQQQEEAKPEIKKYEAEQSAWEAIKSGILDAIKQAAKGSKNTDLLEQDLRKHEDKKPEPPRVPRLIYSDFTPEALTYSLAKKWPSGGVISSEAGAVFGSHAMGKDSQLRTLATLNQLWDATKQKFDRRGESYVVDGARLTMSLQVQESALMEFIGKTGTLARGTGFLARFLICRPESTQGTRLFTEPPENMPALANYYRQINRILEITASINDKGGLTPSMLTLSSDAKAAWIKFHDAIEIGLGKGGELRDVRDVASKIADNAVRLAALFHVIGGGIGAISFDHFEAASIITAWHLNEALRFFGELALPEALADAALLDEWLIEYCRVHHVNVVSTRKISQYGPSKLRDKTKLDMAIAELIEHGRIVLLQSGRKREIMINPQLLR